MQKVEEAERKTGNGVKEPFTEKCPNCQKPIPFTAKYGQVKGVGVKAVDNVMVITIPPPTVQVQKGIPLKGRMKLVWYAMGVASWIGITAYAGFDLAISLMALVAIAATILLGQWHQRTLQEGRTSAERYMFYLWWIGAACTAIGFSLPFLILLFGLFAIGAPFVILDFALWFRERGKSARILELPTQ